MKLLRRLASPGTAALSVHGRRSLRAPLALGALALAVTLCIPAPQYMSLQKPDAADAEPASGKKVDVPDGPRGLPVEVRTLESRGSVSDGADPEQTEAMTRRMAANILLRSGYLANASVTTDPETGRARYAGSVRGEIAGCADRYPPAPVPVPVPAPASVPQTSPAPEPPEQPQAEPPEQPLEAARAGRLGIAVVAVEKFNRNDLQRRAEWLYANALLATSGRLPDLSLGPAQIRPSTIRRLAALPASPADLRKLAGDDRALGDALANECLSLGLAAAVLESLACKDCEDAERHAVMAYAGQRRRTDAAGDYTAVVEAIVAMME
jgi:hypothetical protein